MSASFDLGPPQGSPGSMFFKSQFFASVQWPPKDTNLNGKVAIVTGSTSGLGLEASRQLLSLGLSTLIVTARSSKKGQDVASKFRIQYPKADIHVWSLEMESYESIQAFAHRATTELLRLDIVILNAAMQTADFVLVPGTGHEKYVQVNYLSTMLLGLLLLPVLKTKSPAGTPGRLTIVSSGTARGATIPEPKDGKSVLQTLDDKSTWDPIGRYAVSKLLGHLFLINLVQHINADDVVVNLVDPGLTKGTNLQGFAPLPVRIFFFCFKAILGRAVPVGASTYIDASVVKGKETHGCYVADWAIAPFPAFVFTPEGKAIRESLWQETLAEFEFAGVQKILEDLKR